MPNHLPERFGLAAARAGLSPLITPSARMKYLQAANKRER